jgi:hypothetical protein
MSKTHNLKTWPEYFQACKSGAKKFEVRRNDRRFEVGDFLELHEYVPLVGFTGEKETYKITYILSDPRFGILPGFVCMSIE